MKTNELLDAIVNLDETKIVNTIKSKIDRGEEATEILKEAGEGMIAVGEKYKSGEFALSEVIVAAEFFKEGMKILEPHLPVLNENTLGKVIIGTPKGDIHSIGKNIVATMFKANGFEVYNLGVDVPANAFINKVHEIKPQIVAMSALLTMTFHSMKQIVDALGKAQKNLKFKFLIGGAAVDEKVKEYVGAHYYGKDVIEAVTFAKKIVEELRE